MQTTSSRDGNFWVVVMVNSWVNNQTGSWLAARAWTTNQEPGQQVDLTLTMTTTQKFPLQIDGMADDNKALFNATQGIYFRQLIKKFIPIV